MLVLLRSLIEVIECIRMPGRLNEKKTAMDTRVLDVTFSLSREFFAQICRMLVLDILDDRIPTTKALASVLPIHRLELQKQTICRCSPDHHNPECRQCSAGGEPHSLQLLRERLSLHAERSHARNCILWETVWISVVDLTGSSGARRPLESMRWAAKMVLIKVDFPRPVWPEILETEHQQRRNIWIEGDGRQHEGACHEPTQMTLNWKPRFRSFLSICEVMLSKPTWLRGKTVAVWDMVAGYGQSTQEGVQE